MEKQDKAISWAISLRKSEWDFINAVAEQMGVSRSAAVSIMIKIFRWQNGQDYSRIVSDYISNHVKRVWVNHGDKE